MVRQSAVLIGMSGWRYAPWRGQFYPMRLPQKDELAHLASVFPTVEINGTFYSMQVPDAYRQWFDATPDDFVFAVKGPRFLTHMKRLRDPVVPLANFMASGVLRLGHKLGPILWQFPPNFRFEPERLEAFFNILPRDTEQAARLGRRHDHRLKARAWLRVESPQTIRHAVEIRHESFRDPAFIALLCKHDIALVCADTVEWPLLMDLTADFVYCGCTARANSIEAPTASRARRWAKRSAGVARRQVDDRRHFRRRAAEASSTARRLSLLRQYRQAARAQGRAVADAQAGAVAMARAAVELKRVADEAKACTRCPL